MNLTKMRLGRTPNAITGYREFVLQDNDEQTVTFHKNSKIAAMFKRVLTLIKQLEFDPMINLGFPSDSQAAARFITYPVSQKIKSITFILPILVLNG